MFLFLRYLRDRHPDHQGDQHSPHLTSLMSLFSLLHSRNKSASITSQRRPELLPARWLATNWLTGRPVWLGPGPPSRSCTTHLDLWNAWYSIELTGTAGTARVTSTVTSMDQKHTLVASKTCLVINPLLITAHSSLLGSLRPTDRPTRGNPDWASPVGESPHWSTGPSPGTEELGWGTKELLSRN